MTNTSTLNAVSEKKQTKVDLVIALLVRDEGATLEQIVEATDWQPHTARAALTRLKKRGLSIDSDKVGGVRTYRAAAQELN